MSLAFFSVSLLNSFSSLSESSSFSKYESSGFSYSKCGILILWRRQFWWFNFRLKCRFLLLNFLADLLYWLTSFLTWWLMSEIWPLYRRFSYLETANSVMRSPIFAFSTLDKWLMVKFPLWCLTRSFNLRLLKLDRVFYDLSFWSYSILLWRLLDIFELKMNFFGSWTSLLRSNYHLSSFSLRPSFPMNWLASSIQYENYLLTMCKSYPLASRGRPHTRTVFPDDPTKLKMITVLLWTYASIDEKAGHSLK